MEKQFAEKISKETGIDYLKIYILLYEFLRFLWGRAEAGAKEVFPFLFVVRAKRVLYYYKTHLRCLTHNEDRTELYSFIIDTAFNRAGYLRYTAVNTKHNKRFYRRLVPIDYDPNAYWRTDIVMKESKEMEECYKKFKRALYEKTLFSTELDKQMYDYCKAIFKLYIEIPKIAEMLGYYKKTKLEFKLNIIRKYDKAV